MKLYLVFLCLIFSSIAEDEGNSSSSPFPSFLVKDENLKVPSLILTIPQFFYEEMPIDESGLGSGHFNHSLSLGLAGTFRIGKYLGVAAGWNMVEREPSCGTFTYQYCRYKSYSEGTFVAGLPIYLYDKQGSSEYSLTSIYVRPEIRRRNITLEGATPDPLRSLKALPDTRVKQSSTGVRVGLEFLYIVGLGIEYSYFTNSNADWIAGRDTQAFGVSLIFGFW